MSSRGIVYFMHAATTPLDPRVRQRMIACLEEDPRKEDGLLADGRRIARILEEARERVALFLGAAAEEIIFTSGGTEASNLALKGAAFAPASRSGGARNRLLVAATEHSSVLHPARTLGRLGWPVVEIPVTPGGLVDLDRLEDLLDDRTLLVSVALVNAETGVIQDLTAVARLSHAAGALLHTDACAAAAHLPLDVRDLGADLVSISAHKIYGPRGAGALYVRGGVRLAPLIEGGVNEGGRRGGAENVSAVAGLGEAAALASVERESWRERSWRLGERMAREILSRVAGVMLNGAGARRVKAMVNISVAGADGEALLLDLGRAGIAASSGSPCFQEAGKPSHVLLAMGVPARLAQGSVLFAAGRSNDEEDVEAVLSVFPDAVARLRSLSAVEAV